MKRKDRINADSEPDAMSDGYAAQLQAYHAARQEYRRMVSRAGADAAASALSVVAILSGVFFLALLTIIVWIVLVAAPSDAKIVASVLTVGLFSMLIRVMMASWRVAEQDHRYLEQVKRMQYALPPHPNELPQSYLVRGTASPSLTAPQSLLLPASDSRQTVADERELLRGVELQRVGGA